MRGYILAIPKEWTAFGPYETREDAEFAAMDYYGTAITGASARDEFKILELVDMTPERIRQRTEGP